MRRRARDLLDLLAVEHRDLTAAWRSLRQRSIEVTPERLEPVVLRTVEHELMHRLLLHPLLERDPWGAQMLRERTDEQLRLAARLCAVIEEVSSRPPPGSREPGPDPLRRVDSQLVEHTDREEIVTFPHLRRLVEPSELCDLLRTRQQLCDVLLDQLALDRAPVRDGSWATAAVDHLVHVIELPDDVIELPDDVTVATPRVASDGEPAGAR